jgi:hypothetical protein
MLFYLQGSHSRAESGLHNYWQKVKKWLTFSGPLTEPVKEEPGKKKIKCPEIPILKDYNSDHDSDQVRNSGPSFRRDHFRRK